MMRRIICACAILFFSHSSIAQEYQGWWAEVNELINQGQPKSALAKLEKIHTTALEENNGPMLVKALIHEVKLKAQYEEYSLQLSINRLDSVAETLDAPNSNILHSMLGEMYWGYYRQNQWQFHQRTFSESTTDDIATWDFRRIVLAADAHFKESLTNPDRLNKLELERFAGLLQGRKDHRNLRPTLYHLLISRALDFYASEERDLLNLDQDGFFNNPDFLATSEKFLTVELLKESDLEPAVWTTQLFQELIRISKDVSTDSHVLEDLNRLEFFHRRSRLENKDSLYRASLDKLLETHSESSISSDIRYAIGQLLYTQGNSYDVKSGDENLRKNWAEAHEICSLGVEAQSNSIGTNNCQALISQIEQRSIGLNTKQVELPNADFLIKVDYRNIGNVDQKTWPVYARIASLDPIEHRKNQRGYHGEKLIRWLKKISTTVVETKFEVPNPGDFRPHGIELPFEGLPVGSYAIFIGTDEKLNTSNNAVGVAIVHVSDIATLQQVLPDGTTRLAVKSRHKGTPLVGAKVRLIRQTYDRDSRSQRFELEKEITTEANGEIFWKSNSGGRHQNFIVDVIHQSDQLIGSGSLYNRHFNGQDKWRESTSFFLDRAIYRPGQTVNFKGIITSSNGMENKVVKDKNTTVKLYDTNGQEVSSLNLKANRFGTFSGTFILPSSGLNGHFRIGNENGSHSFRMEEYKRPKFEVTLDQPQDQFRVGDSVSVDGAAMTYSGVPLSNADFRYRIVRRTSYPYRWLCWYWQPPSQQKQVAFGSGTTDANGQFTIDFEASPDNSVNPKYKPVFSYSIEVDVTDVSGEVQSTTSSVSVGYHALNLSMELPDEVERKSLDKYQVSAKNLSGVDQSTKVTVLVWTLKQPNRPYRKRKWSEPDQHLVPKARHIGRFFYDPFADEWDPRTWEKDKNMLDAKIYTASDPMANLKPLKGLPAGKYLVELKAKDAFGTEVTQQQYFTLFGVEDGKVPFPQTSWLNVEKSTLEPGEDLQMTFGSSYPDVTARVQLEVKAKGRNVNKIIYDELLTVSHSTKSIQIPVTEEWRGNAQVHFTFIRNNEVFILNRMIRVPYSNRKLDVNLETFRKEMSPDDKEEWTISIKNKDGQTENAELLTTMYDASLDVLAPNNWGLNLDSYLRPRHSVSSSNFNLASSHTWDRNWRLEWRSPVQRRYENLNWFGYHFGAYRGRYDMVETMAAMPGVRSEAVMIMSDGMDADNGMAEAEEPMAGVANRSADVNRKLGEESGKEPEIRLRSDFSETVFFHPHLESDENGLIQLKFNAPQSLTKWKFMALATSEDLKIGSLTEEVVTQKQLMITPNYPRFVREGDKLTFQVKVNLIDTTIFDAYASLEVKNGLSLKPLKVNLKSQKLKIENGQAVARWELEIPEGMSALQFTAKAWGTGHNENGMTRTHSDGEEKTIPVLPNRMLVTEALPLPVRGKGTHEFNFEHLAQQFGAKASTSLNHENLAVEFTPNPVWLAVLALPYMMEYPYECSEQLFSRYYANAIGTYLANSDPSIKRVFDQWKRDAEAGNGNALESQLDKNPELKQVLLNETPWVRDAQDEGERRKRLALLFDTDRMESELATTLKKLKANKKPDGGWGWFGGMRSNPYITRYILAGFGKMRKMGVWQPDSETSAMLESATRFLDNDMVQAWERQTKHDRPSHRELHTLYARSFWLNDYNLKGKASTIHGKILKKVDEHWTDFDAFRKGMAAVVLHRNGDKLARQVMVSLRETALTSEEFGMYWAMDKGYYWYHAPIENHVMILEAFHEVEQDKKVVDEMKIWLLKQKQTQDWKTTKATAEACYALLSTGNVNLNVEPRVSIQLGDRTIDPRKDKDLKSEAGTGYFKKSFSGESITSGMEHITVNKEDEGVSWGAVYWQYFENLDQIKRESQNPIRLSREILQKVVTDEGYQLHEFEGDDRVEVGGTYTVRITLRTDRNMEFVHLKDMRAATFEPREQLSGVQNQEGLYYYQSPTDVAMNFFFDYLPKGTFVFEYDLNATQLGEFSNGISQIQCMYAPEFTTHSEGGRVEVR